VQTRYENENNLQYLNDAEEQDREISLGTTTILGIFFALALICAVFFGFGYTMGRRSAIPAAATDTKTSLETPSSKPSPGAPADQTVKPSDSTSQSAIVPIDSPGNAIQESPQTATQPVTIKASAPDHSESPAQPLPTPSKPAMIPVSTIASGPGTLVVQVAAMSHQEDADVVAVDLKRRGYTVAVRHEPQDKFFHVQIGPFSTKKEADSMRQRLQTDGYNNAIVK
jgi:DedD protein